MNYVLGHSGEIHTSIIEAFMHVNFVKVFIIAGFVSIISYTLFRITMTYLNSVRLSRVKVPISRETRR